MLVYLTLEVLNRLSSNLSATFDELQVLLIYLFVVSVKLSWDRKHPATCCFLFLFCVSLVLNPFQCFQCFQCLQCFFHSSLFFVEFKTISLCCRFSE